MGISFAGSDHTRRHPRWTDLFLPISLDPTDPRRLDLSASNAVGLFVLLGLVFTSTGECPIAEARAGLLRARLRFAAIAGQYTRDAVEEQRPLSQAGPNGSADVLVTLLPRAQPVMLHEPTTLRFFVGGLEESDLARYLVAFERLLDALEELGATHLRWS